VTLSFAAVDFELSPDQQELRSAAVALLDDLASSERVREFVGPGLPVVEDPGVGADVGPAVGFDHALWAAMAEQGWTAVERPAEDGGLGLSLVEVAVLCEELGRRAAPVPYLDTVVCLDALDQASAEYALSDRAAQDVGQWTGQLATGESVGCVAWSTGSGLVTARPDGDLWRISGKPEPTHYAPVADVAVVVADGSLYALGLDNGLRPRAEPAMDRTRPLGWLVLDDTPAYRIGSVAGVERLTNRVATVSAADALGASARALEMSVDYAKVRRQFGHPIGSFQAVKHRLADALVDVEAMRSSTYYAAWCVANGDPEAALAASMAKAWCSDASRRVTGAALQAHGGIGFTWDHDLHLFLKRAQLDAVGFGDAAWHRDRVAGLLAERSAAGGSPL
jgi:alkylation response protein AidB-like acyl-CoA dehydrogenase